MATKRPPTEPPKPDQRTLIAPDDKQGQPDPPQLRVTAITIRQVLGAEELTITPGQITIASGPNGSGKSTIIDALQAGLFGGGLAKLARIDPETGEAGNPEVVVVLEGEGDREIRIHRDGKGVDVTRRVDGTAAFERVAQPQALLNALVDVKGCNPVAFLRAADKDRALMLLEALPLTFDRAELLAAMKVDPATLPAIPKGLHPLEEVSLIRQGVFDRRTGINVSLRDKRATSEEIRRGCPAKIPGDPIDAIARLDREVGAEAVALAQAEVAGQRDEKLAREAAQAAYDAGDAGVRSKLSAWKGDRKGQHDRKAAELRAEVERRIAALAGEMETEIEGQETAAERELDALEEMRDEAMGAARAALEEARERLAQRQNALGTTREELAGLRAQSDEAKRVATLFGQVQKFDEQADELEGQAKHLTAALETLDAYARRMAENLPIPGLSIEGKVIRVDGVPFEQLNLAQRTEIAVEVAALRAKGQALQLIVVDDAEKFDSAHLAALCKALAARGLQVVVGRVSDEPFTVTAA